MELFQFIRSFFVLHATVDRLYGGKFSSDAERLAHLFALYKQMTCKD